MNLIKSTLILGALIMGINAQAAELFDVQNAVETHLIPNLALITTEYVDCIAMFVYPGEFVQFGDLDEYQQKDIITAFGMVNPEAECARVSRHRIHANTPMSRLDRISVSIFDDKQDKQLVLTKHGEYLGRMEQEKGSTHSWPSLQRTIACWTTITQKSRTGKLSHEELIKLMQSY